MKKRVAAQKKKKQTGQDFQTAGEIVRDFGEHFMAARIGTHASSTAFFFFLSFIPILIIAVRLVPLFGLSDEMIVRVVTRVAPDIAADFLETIIRETMTVSHRIVPVSLVLLVWAASQGTIALLYGLNKVYDVTEHRNIFLIYLTCIGYTIAMLVLIAVMFYLIFGNAVSRYLNSLIPEIGVPGAARTTWHSFLFLVVGSFFFTLIYTFIPAGIRKLTAQIPGAVFSAAVWLIFSDFFRIYVNAGNRFTNFYGSIGTIAILLFWLYCCFYILLLGGLVNEYYTERIRPYFFRRT